MFNRDNFIEDCIKASTQGQGAIREILAEAVSDSKGIMKQLGQPSMPGITPLYRSSELTIVNFVWGPQMTLMPHNHNMAALIGVYSGREDNIFWRRSGQSIEAAGARSLGAGDVTNLGSAIIHSVTNPIEKLSSAIHIYQGDFFDPKEPRSGWDHETLQEQAWDVEKVKTLFFLSQQKLMSSS
ncbi:MAG: metal-dependent protein of the double-stranded beta helix superfamily-like protein [Osedax symbiont Rs2]|nr:MAG: metal-dependent protein of the double-stranded beta helix superfamily-like protein [Osedax symbiont Rs2]